jgi:predicted PurR-regulated permease PerM
MTFSGRTFFPLVILLVAAYFLFLIHDILLPFILAGALAYLLNPAVRFFEMRGFRRAPVVVLMYAVLVITFVFLTYKVGSFVALDAQGAAHNMPLYVHKGGEVFARLRGSIHPVLFDFLADHGKVLPQDILRSTPSFALGVIPMIEVAFLVPFISFFFIREGHDWRDRMVGLVPSRYVEMLLNLFFELDNSLGRYIRGILMEAVCVGLLAFGGFWAIHLTYALPIAVIVGLANIAPYVGPVIGILLGGGAALFQWGSLAGILKVILVCAGVRFIEDWFIQPTVLQNAVRLHPVLVLLALMSGAELFGFWGLLFAVPVACTIKVLFEVLWPWYRSQYGFVTPPPLPEINRIPFI